MSTKPKTGVRVDTGAPYRDGAENLTPQLQANFGAAVDRSRSQIGEITNIASVTGALLASGVVVNWEPGLAKNCALLLTTALTLAPQYIKYSANKDLNSLGEYKHSVSAYVDNDDGQVNRDANRKVLMPLRNLAEHAAGPTYEVEAGVLVFMIALNAFSNCDLNDPMKDLAALGVVMITAILAALATFATRYRLRKERDTLRAEMAGFLKHIPVPTRVVLSVVDNAAPKESANNNKAGEEPKELRAGQRKK